MVSVCTSVHTYFCDADDNDDYELLMTWEVSNEKPMNGKRTEHDSCACISILTKILLDQFMPFMTHSFDIQKL